MKIIGTTKDGFMLQASTEEVATMLTHVEGTAEVGQSVNLVGLFDKLEKLKKTTALRLREAADKIDGVAK